MFIDITIVVVMSEKFVYCISMGQNTQPIQQKIALDSPLPITIGLFLIIIATYIPTVHGKTFWSEL